MRRTILVASALMLFGSVADAGLLRGVGGDSCGKYIAESAGLPPAKSKSWSVQGAVYFGKSHVYSEWIQGYLTALSVNSDLKKVDRIDYAGIDLWLRNYCDKNPTKNIYNAVEALISEHVKN